MYRVLRIHANELSALDLVYDDIVEGRKKDLIKTAGGKYIAPQPIESRLKACPLILNAVVVGEAHKFPAALIVPAPRATREQIQAEVDARWERLLKGCGTA